MKSHFVSLIFWNVYGKNLVFQGRVIGKEINGKIVISPEKIFRQVFGFSLPDHTKIEY